MKLTHEPRNMGSATQLSGPHLHPTDPGGAALYQGILAYDGTGFEGFQRQFRARTVQGVVEAALRDLGWQEEAIRYAGRTDTGVHALGQVIAFRLTWRHTPQALRNALNARLPQDVALLGIQIAPEGFHPRYHARARRYVYRIYLAPVRHPLHQRYTWRVWPPPDWARLQRATALLPGRRDFRALGTPTREAGSTVRTVYHARWYRLHEQEWALDIVADAFLYHMVRRTVALLVALGQGRMAEKDWHRALETPPPQPLQGLAPPQGLYLAAVYYQDPWPVPETDADFRAWWQSLFTAAAIASR